MSLRSTQTIIRCIAFATGLGISGIIPVCLLAYIFGRWLSDPTGFHLWSRSLAYTLVLLTLITDILYVAIRGWRNYPKEVDLLSLLWVMAGAVIFFSGTLAGFCGHWNTALLIMTITGSLMCSLGIWLKRQAAHVQTAPT